MKNRIFLLAALLLPLAVHAQNPTAKKYHTLTVTGHWMASPFMGGDSLTNIIMDTTHGAFAWTHANYGTGGLTAEQYLSYMSLGATNGFTKTDSSTKTLGGRSFVTVGWKQDGADGDTAGRVRTYAHLNNTTGLLFVAWIIFDDPEGTPAIAEFEAMLAGATVGIRRIPAVAWNRNRDAHLPRLDVMGRTWRASSARPAATPYFLRR